MNVEEKKKIKIKFACNYLLTIMEMIGLMMAGFALSIAPSNILFMLFGFLIGLVTLLWTLDLIEKYRYKYKGIDE